MICKQKLKFFVNLCLWSSLKSATDCCQAESQIQQDAVGYARIARVAQQCLYENYPQTVENEQWSMAHVIINTLSDENGIHREIRNMYIRTNTLFRKFNKCSITVKIQFVS